MVLRFMVYDFMVYGFTSRAQSSGVLCSSLSGFFTISTTCTEAGSYLRPIDSCITQLKAQGPSRTCNESTEEGATRSCPATMGNSRMKRGAGAAVQVLKCR